MQFSSLNADKEKAIWIIMEHPNELILAICLAAYFKKEKFVVNLLISLHGYWNKVDLSKYQKYFNKISKYKRIDYASFRILQEILNIFCVRRQISKLDIKEEDIIISLSPRRFLENLIFSKYRKNKKIVIMSEDTYLESTTIADKLVYKWTKRGLLFFRFVEPLFKMHQTLCMLRRREELKPAVDGIGLLRCKAEITEIYDKIFVMKNIFVIPPQNVTKNTHRINKVTDIHYPYILMQKSPRITYKNSVASNKKVVFFGSSFLKDNSLESKEYIMVLNKCLNYLRRFYGGQHKLIYRPHPAESEEICFIDLHQFEIEQDSELSELYLMDHADEIFSVFSVSSTSSRTALNFGINAYMFFPVFPFRSMTKEYYKRLMGNVPDACYIKDLAKPCLEIVTSNLRVEMETQSGQDMKKILREI